VTPEFIHAAKRWHSRHAIGAARAMAALRARSSGGELAPCCRLRHCTYTPFIVQRPWSRAWRVSCVLVPGLSTSFLASPARACSQLERVIESSYPAPGATDVPTNVVLYAAGDHVDAEGLYLETAAGVRVPVTVSGVLPTGFDITPVIELDPNQRYVLHHPGFSLLAAGPVSTSVEFETGGGPAVPELLPPPELAGAVVLDGAESPCPNERLCLEPGNRHSALFGANSFNNVSERTPGILTGAYGNAFVPEACLEIWRRDALGNRSEAVELCAPDVTASRSPATPPRRPVKNIASSRRTSASPTNPAALWLSWAHPSHQTAPGVPCSACSRGSD